ncbi:MAG: hypothetical protein IKE43_12720 [Coriobacteriales bacterium]|nr:hypothetical protein [Coriobacteriales bacterium]
MFTKSFVMYLLMIILVFVALPVAGLAQEQENLSTGFVVIDISEDSALGVFPHDLTITEEKEVAPLLYLEEDALPQETFDWSYESDAEESWYYVEDSHDYSSFSLYESAVNDTREYGYGEEEARSPQTDSQVQWTGWHKENGVWYYYDQNSNLLHGWQKYKDAWYYLDTASGAMQTGWRLINDAWYYFEASGKMRTGWLKYNDTWYYLGAGGKMRTGWISWNDKWYYCTQSGRMVTGWHKIDDVWYYFNNPSGSMRKGWLLYHDSWYYLAQNGKMQVGWLQINSARYYLNPSGRMQTGWKKIDGFWYYFGSNGKMRTGWQQVNDSWYFLNGDGQMHTGWLRRGSYLYYLDTASGKMYTGSHVIAGVTCYFEESGRASSVPLNGTTLRQGDACYSYELYFLDNTYEGLWSGVSRPVYMRTENTQPDSIRLTNKDGENIVSFGGYTFSDITYKNNIVANGFRSVEGGYLIALNLSDPGIYTMQLRELTFEGYVVVQEFTLEVQDYDAALTTWIDTLIEDYTTPSMTSLEKMQEICDYLDNKSGFSYHTCHDDKTVYLAGMPNQPFFITKRWDSSVSPYVLSLIAQRIGGFEDVHDCYDDYDRTKEEWATTHYLCRVTYEGSDYYFSSCPAMSSGEVGEVVPLDLNNTGSLYLIP